MNVKTIHDNIWELVDFLSAKELEYFYTLASSASEDDWMDKNAPEHWRGRNLNLSSTKETQSLEKKIAAQFLNYEKIHQLNHILRARNGEFLGEHVDNAEPVDYNNQFGLVIYLNDDYEGGELYYPALNISHKPAKGSMVVHYAGILHGVRPVKGDVVRYIMTSFVKGPRETLFIGEN